MEVGIHHLIFSWFCSRRLPASSYMLLQGSFKQLTGNWNILFVCMTWTDKEMGSRWTKLTLPVPWYFFITIAIASASSVQRCICICLCIYIVDYFAIQGCSGKDEVTNKLQERIHKCGLWQQHALPLPGIER